MGFQILFTDMDDTLLNSRSQVSAFTRRAVADALDAGKRIVLCSGRSWRSLAPFELSLGLTGPDRYGIAFNGGVVYETAGHRMLFERHIGEPLGREVITALAEAGADAIVYAGSKVYAARETPELREYITRVRLDVTMVSDFAEVPDDIIKIIIRGRYDFLSGIERHMAQRFGERMNIVFSSENLLEFAHSDAHKGRALAFLAGYLGVPLNETIAAGDQANDISMLQTAGLGVAVANAHPAAKAAADLVTNETCDEDAVGRLIYTYLLEK